MRDSLLYRGACKKDSLLKVLWHMYDRILTLTSMGRVRETRSSLKLMSSIYDRLEPIPVN